jgi:glycosyltransferase involved in cell wall biosynthesis
MTDPLVTILIPCFNYGRFVTEAVESALAQTYPHCETIVVDDGSTDDTRIRLAPYTDRVRYIYQDNQGPDAARNTGIRAARGEFIGLLDADDLWHPRKLELQMQVFREHPHAGLVAANDVLDLSRGWPAIDSRQGGAIASFSVEDLAISPRFGASSVVLRKACLDRVGMFEDFPGVEDRDLWLRIADQFVVLKLLVPLWWYWIHGTSASFSVLRMEKMELAVLRKAFATLPSLQGRWLLKRKSLSRALVANAHMFDATGLYARAVGNLVRSVFLWPLPYRRNEAKTTWIRPKMSLLILWRWLRSFVASLRRALTPMASGGCQPPVNGQ